ncbi:hypothetical protein PTKIN_Ptkin06aG0202000 [Pterospermum kingtungense]
MGVLLSRLGVRNRISLFDNRGNWRLIGFYGHPDRDQRRSTWNLLDRSAWHFTKNGIYVVKSGYKLIFNSTDLEQYKVEGGWGSIWDFHVLPKYNVKTTVYHALGYLCEWLNFRCKKDSEQPSSSSSFCQKWHAPEAPFVSCNVDATFGVEARKTGVGFVLRDHLGKFLLGRSFWYDGLLPVREGDVVGVREALLWVQQLGFRLVCFETDAKYVADAISSTSLDISEYGSLIQDCVSILKNERFFCPFCKEASQ